MAEYAYKAIIYKNTDGVVGVDTVQNTADKTDFETNRKSTAVVVDSIVILQITFLIDKTYTQFKALITGDYTWADVRYIDDGQKYQIYLITNQPL